MWVVWGFGGFVAGFGRFVGFLGLRAGEVYVLVLFLSELRVKLTKFLQEIVVIYIVVMLRQRRFIRKQRLGRQLIQPILMLHIHK